MNFALYHFSYCIDHLYVNRMTIFFKSPKEFGIVRSLNMVTYNLVFTFFPYLSIKHKCEKPLDY